MGGKNVRVPQGMTAIITLKHMKWKKKEQDQKD